MIDININAIISQALAAAVQQAVDAHITALRQEYANKMGEMAERIAALENNPAQGVDTTLERRVAALEFCNADRHQRLRVLEGALTDRVVALEDRIAVLAAELIADNPAQGVDTTLNAWEMAMQNRVASADAVAQRMHERVLALEMHTAVLHQHGGIVEYLDNQEWFWDKIRNFTDGAVESAVERHCEEYDHDDYDRVVSALDGVDLDDYVTKDAMRDEMSDAVHDKLDNATLSIRF